MSITNIFQIFRPKGDKFFTLFEESVNNLKKAADLLKEISHASPGERQQLVEQMHELEHKGDQTTHNIFNELSSTFLTPFDQEDIYRLTSTLDDIVDCIDGGAGRFTLYEIQKTPKDMISLIEVLDKSTGLLKEGISYLRHITKEPAQMRSLLTKVHEYENQADDIFELAIAELFKMQDPIQLIKLKEIYVILETATDKCEDAANVLESILIKNG
ncbi:MAG: DUF47 domain-containing protein [Bacteroidetes bacterium]|nr:MAG: DUF47 domain-containing protein [Bacteroidota bacterium]